MKTEITKKTTWSAEDRALIQKTVARGTTESEFKLFLYTATKYELDPLIKQVWCVKYGNAPAAIFTGRDGFLHIAHRTGQFNGMETVPNFNEKGELVSATCKVWRKDMDNPFVVTVYRQEYDTHKSNWAKMPITMLQKVAESQALRRAFDISGLYAPEEYNPAETSQSKVIDITTEEPEQKPAPKPKKSTTNYKFLQEMQKLKKQNEEVYYSVLSDAGFKHANEITDRQQQLMVYKTIKADIETIAASTEPEEVPVEPAAKNEVSDEEVAAKLQEVFGGEVERGEK